jgi:undecaprenyl-diphosphatase
MPALSFLGDWGLIWLLAAAVLLCTKKYRKTGLMLLGTLLLCTLAGNGIIKPLVGRLRPCQVDLAAPLLIARPQDFSFPSGHAASSFGAAVCVLRGDKRLGAAALVWPP